MRVLITIGTMAEKNFTRLFQILDEICKEGILDGANVLAQVGEESYQPRYYKTFKMASDEVFNELIQEADLIISHAGTGTVTKCLKQGKKVIVFPRQLKFDEHYDDHQMELTQVFSVKGHILSALNKKELVECIRKVENFNPVPFRSNNRYFNQLVLDSIEGTLRVTN